MKRVMFAALTAGTLAFALPAFAQSTMPKDYLGPGGNGQAQVNERGQMGPGGNGQAQVNERGQMGPGGNGQAQVNERGQMGPGGNGQAQTKEGEQAAPGGNAQTKEASPNKDENGMKTEENKD